jgi:hypothetical protein
MNQQNSAVYKDIDNVIYASGSRHLGTLNKSKIDAVTFKTNVKYASANIYECMCLGKN